MPINTKHLERCIKTLESSLEHLNAAKKNSIDYEIFRNAVIKGFELSLETTGKLLRKTLKSFHGNPRAVDALTYKEILREAAKSSLIDPGAIERWFQYRDNRNNTAHDYGEDFAEETLCLLPPFLQDVKALQKIIEKKLGT
jgi:nucleotidyltransferase substrate binding protein (TIGR01987 family)